MDTHKWGVRAGYSALFLLLISHQGARADVEFAGQYLHQRAEFTDFNGAVLIKRSGDIVLREAFGSADRELGVRLTPDAIFRIGSLTKPLTATGILLLAEEELLALDDSVCSFVKDCPSRWTVVKIRNLLNHTSGVPDFFGRLDAVPVEDTAAEVDRVLAALSSSDLLSEPGDQYSYTNFNYVLLGYVIDQVTGEYWEDFLTEEMFGPLGMNDTRYDDVWSIVPGRARGYTVTDNEVANIEYDDHAAYAAGGLRSTIDDLEIWHSAYVSDDIIGSRSRKMATTPGLGNYGLGWQVLTMFGRKMYNHTGGIDGFVSHLAYYPDDELLLLVLSNSDQEDAKATACDIAALMFDAAPLPTGDAAWLETARSQRCRESGVE